MSHDDIIGKLAALQAGSWVDRLRDARREARLNAQASYEALFKPVSFGDVSAVERFAIATFVVGLHRHPATLSHYGGALASLAPSVAVAVAGEIDAAAGSGPWGRFPEGPLEAENDVRAVYSVHPTRQGILGVRLSVALEHAHLLVFHPRDATRQSLQLLQEAGWSTDAIVTLSQIVAFLSFQVRVAAGLAALASAGHVTAVEEAV